MDKLTMAHEYFLRIVSNPSVTLRAEDLQNIQNNAWVYADVMQAEADKREKEKQDKAKQEQQNYEDALDSIGVEQWHPDWSQAPDDKITHWTMEKDKRYSWWIGEPKKDSQNHYESIENANCSFYGDAPSFNYQGNWQDSLKKRP